MAGQKQLIVNITAAGSVKIEAVNCEGTECVDASAPIEVVLGGHGKREEKPEYYQSPGVSTENTIRRAF